MSSATHEDNKSSDSTVKQVLYAIPSNERGGRLLCVGDSSSSRNAVFFCGGFPDDCRLFLDLAQSLDCFGALTCLPGYDTAHCQEYKPSGYTVDEIVASLREAFRTFCKLCTHPSPTITIVLHDWGCIFGSMMVNRLQYEQDQEKQIVHKMVFMDVLPPFHPEENVPSDKDTYRKFVYVCYQSLLALGFWVDRHLSEYLAISLVLSGFALLELFRLTPLTNIEHQSYKQRKISLRFIAYRSYVYYYAVLAVLASWGDICKALPDFFIPKNAQVFYLYGKQERVHFHDAMHVKQLGDAAVCIDEAGHWLMLQQPKQTYHLVRDFLNVQQD